MVVYTLIYIKIHMQNHSHTNKHTPLPCYPKQTLIYLNSNWTILQLFIPRLQIEGGVIKALLIIYYTRFCHTKVNNKNKKQKKNPTALISSESLNLPLLHSSRSVKCVVL